MKIIHTADWHIGQTFFGHDRRREHAIFFEWLREQVREHKVDLLLIAGDIFDTANPSAEAQKVYYTFLRTITAENPNLQIIITAGNHDSAARLEAPSPLLDSMNIAVRGVVKRKADGEVDYSSLVVPINGGGYCLAVPYLRPSDYAQGGSYCDGVANFYSATYDAVEDKSQPIVAMGHLQATGSELSLNDSSEKGIIGGMEAVSLNDFADKICYTALGHLHRSQRVSKRENMRYAGAPLPMSFAEKNNKQGVTLVTIDSANGNKTTIERLEFSPPVKLLSIPKEPSTLEEALYEIAKLPDGVVDDFSPIVEVKIVLTKPEPSLRVHVEKALAGKAVRLGRLSAVSKGASIEGKMMTSGDLQSIKPLDMADRIYKSKHSNDMPSGLRSLLEGIIVEEENRD